MTGAIRYLDLADFLLIAEMVLGVPAEELKFSARLELADSALHAPRAGFGGIEFYPSFAMKAAVLGARLIKNHPLPDGNKRVGFLAMIEFAERNGLTWTPPLRDSPEGDETVEIIEGVASGAVDEGALAKWVAERLGCPPQSGATSAPTK